MWKWKKWDKRLKYMKGRGQLGTKPELKDWFDPIGCMKKTCSKAAQFESQGQWYCDDLYNLQILKNSVTIA